MFKFAVAFLLLVTASTFAVEEKVKSPKAPIFQDILKLEEQLKQNPNDTDVPATILQLSRMYFKAGWLRIKEAETEDNTPHWKRMDTEAIDCMLKCSQYYWSVNPAARNKYSTRGTDHLMIGIACYFLGHHIVPKNPKKDIDYKNMAMHYLTEASWYLAREDGRSILDCIYILMAMYESGAGEEHDLLLSHLAQSHTLNLSGEKDQVIHLVEALYLYAAKHFNARGDFEKTLELLPDDLAPPAKSDTPVSYLRGKLLVEKYKALFEAKGVKKSRDFLIELATANAGNEIGRMTLPLVEEWIARCVETQGQGGKRILILPEVMLVLADEYMLENQYENALQNYRHFFQLRPKRSLLKKCKTTVQRNIGVCSYNLKRWDDAIKTFKDLIDEESKTGNEPDPQVMSYWFNALCAKAEDSKDGVDRLSAEKAKATLMECGMDPAKPLPEPKKSRPVAMEQFPPLDVLFEPDSSVMLKNIVSKTFKVEGKGGKANSRAILFGLDWLARHQDPEGFWDSDNFVIQCKSNKCNGPGAELHDVGNTGLALLAFIGAGNTPCEGRYKEVLKKGFKFLCDIQDPENGGILNGSLSNCYYSHDVYNHAIATLALAEGYRRSRLPALLVPLSKAIRYIHDTKNPGRAWGYNFGEVDPIEQNNVSITGWMMRALLSSWRCGLHVDKSDLTDALTYLDDMTDYSTGRCGYKERGTYSGREKGDEVLWPPEYGEAMTALAMLCRMESNPVFDNQSDYEEIIQKGAELLLAKRPKWGVDKEGKYYIDYYYWYYGSYSMFKMGGNEWNKWNMDMIKTVIENQRTDGCEKGSWDPQYDPWGDNGGRVYATAMCLMTLEVYYSDR
jgi:tetratricopeptide (TPR) repeat protein